MKKFIPDTLLKDTPQTLAGKIEPFSMDRYELFVGLDVHKDTIAVAVARPGAQYAGESW